MKNITTITSTALLIAATNLSAQVGINTDTPKSTLDVVGKATDITSLDGITAPRLTGDQLRAKTYTSAQTGALVYVTVADTTPAGQTVNVTAVGYFYFDGAVWQKVTNGVAATEPWYNQATSAQATANTQDIYQTGKVSIGKNASNGLLSVYDPAATTNMVPFYLGYVSQTDNTKNPFLMAAGNLGTGSYSTLSIAGDQALVFSVDGDPTTYTRNSLELIPHVNGGGAAPFGFKITDQGMFSFNAQYPTETLDLGTGTARIRNLPLNGSTNSIYTTPAGGASLPASTNINGLAATQPFNANRTVVADANGVLGTVNYLPSVPVVLAGADGSDATGNASVTIQSINDVTGEASLTQRTFSITKKSLVTFSFSVGVGTIQQYGGAGNITDGISKQIGARLVFNAVPSGSPYIIGNSLIRSAMPYTASVSGGAYGYFFLNGTEILVLDPGSYTVDLRGYVYTKDNGQGIRALFDGGVDRLNIVAIPMQ